MAPRKEKTEKTNADQGSAMIIDYLKKQNRPYSATDISANLHNKVTKAYAAKALKELHDGQLIGGKASGKQNIYHALQPSDDATSLEDLAAMDKEIANLRESLSTLKANEKLLRSNLVNVNAILSTEELRVHVQSLEAKKVQLLARLGPLRKGDVKPVSQEEKTEVDRLWSFWKSKADGRKNIALEVWRTVTQVLPEGQTEGELWEELGLEGDS